MFDYSVYFGTEKEEQFLGFISEQGLFAILVADGLTKENYREFLKNSSSVINKQNIVHLTDFDGFITEKMREFNIPAGIDFAAGYIRENKCFIKTLGEGEIYIKRGNNFSKLIEGDKSASGLITPGDFFIFTNRGLISNIAHDQDKLIGIIGDKSPTEVKEEVYPILKEKDDTGLIALFVNVKGYSKVEEQPAPYEPKVVEKKEAPSIVKLFTTKVRELYEYIKSQDKKQNFKTIVVGTIFFTLMVSVAFGYYKKANQTIDKRLQSGRELIAANLAQAEEVAFLNQERASALLAEARDNLSALKKDLGKKRSKDIAELVKMIEDRERNIFKKEKKEYEEFFDLSIESKDASGQKLYLNEDNLTVLDPGRNLYLLSISKKSIDKKNFKEIKNSTLVGVGETAIFMIGSDGIYKIEEDKIKKIASRDSSWGKIVDVGIYNNNVYLLDSKNNQIHKYTPAENDYARTSYFKNNQGVNFQSATSLSIDSSVYVSLKNKILKYIGAAPDNFPSVFPNENVSIYDISTAQDIEKIYAWDREAGTLYIFNKTGSYERQIESDILKKASDFVVSANNAYILNGSKIYKMNLD